MKRRRKAEGSRKGTGSNLAPDVDDEPGSEPLRLVRRQQPSLAQGCDRGVELLALGFNELADFALVSSLVGPLDRKNLDGLPRHLVVMDAEPIEESERVSGTCEEMSFEKLK